MFLYGEDHFPRDTGLRLLSVCSSFAMNDAATKATFSSDNLNIPSNPFHLLPLKASLLSLSTNSCIVYPETTTDTVIANVRV